MESGVFFLFPRKREYTFMRPNHHVITNQYVNLRYFYKCCLQLTSKIFRGIWKGYCRVHFQKSFTPVFWNNNIHWKLSYYDIFTPMKDNRKVFIVNMEYLRSTSARIMSKNYRNNSCYRIDLNTLLKNFISSLYYCFEISFVLFIDFNR